MHSAWFRSTFRRVFKFLKTKEGWHNFWKEQVLQKVWIIWSPLLYFNFKSFMDPNSSPFIIFQWILHDSGILFAESWNFLKLKREDLISGGEPILQKVWIIWSPLLYFNFKGFLEPNSLSFITFQCILHDSGVLFSESWNFYKLKRGRPNFWWKSILQKVWIIWSPLLYFYFKSFLHPNSLSLLIFQCILHVSGVFFADSSNF